MNITVTKADETMYAAQNRLYRWVDTGQPVRVYGSEWTPEVDVKFARVEDVQSYVNKVLAFVGEPRPIRVRSKRGDVFSYYSHGEIAMATTKGHLRGYTVLHEIAHHLVPGDRHGANFSQRLVRLLDETGHPVASRLLHITLHEEGVLTS